MKTLNTYNQIIKDLQKNAPKAEKTSQTSAPRKAGVASEKSQAYYLKVCKRKNVDPIKNYELLSQNNLSEIIKKTQALEDFFPATDGQKEAVKGRYVKCRMDEPDDEFLDKLSVTQASSIIQKMDDYYEKHFAHIPSEKQLAFISKMMMCPDIDSSELYEVPAEILDKKDSLEKEITLNNSAVNQILNLQQDCIMENDTKRLKKLQKAQKDAEAVLKSLQDDMVATQKEIDEYADSFSLDKLVKQQCTEFISKNQAVFYRWNKDRASQGQRDLINKLLVRSGNPELDELNLMQFTEEQASQYISQLQAEGMQKFGSEIEPEYEDIDRDINFPKTFADAQDAYHENITDVVYKLCAILGQNADNNPIFASENFDSELIDLIGLAHAFSTKEHLIELLAPVMQEEDVVKILG